jgi:hypothetical protein
LIMAVRNFDEKPKFDDTFESGYYVQELPHETYLMYYRYKRILIVSPRDMVLIGKIHRVSPTEAYVAV